MIRPSETVLGTQLNSVWLEGILVADPVDLSSGTPACRFRVQVPWSAVHNPPSIFLVEASESALAGCRARLGRGGTVRIIGRLHQHRWRDPKGVVREEVKIVGEMVEPSEVLV